MDAHCPRCGMLLVPAHVSDLSLAGCSRCGGVWLDPRSLGTVLRAMHEPALEHADRSARAATVDVDTSGRLECPACRRAMDRMTMPQSHVEVDRCADHGTWFDRRELRHAAEAVTPSRGTGHGTTAVAVAVGVGAVAVTGASVAAGSMATAETQTRSRDVEMAGEGVETAAEVALEAPDLVDAAVAAPELAGVALDGVSVAASAATEGTGAAVEVVAVGAEAAGDVLEGALAVLGGILAGLG